MEYGWWSLLCLTWTTLIFSVTCTDLKVREAELVGQLLDLYQHNATFARQYDKTFGAEAAGQPVKQTFPCPVLPPSPTVPTSVHSLRPGDIKVVAAIGDSLTAGRGASGGIIGLLIDYRGQAWSIGGDDDYTDMSTMPNILRMYNPDVYGYSQGVNNKKARFNVAVTGAKAGEALEQAKELVGRLQSDSNIDFENDWKVITVFLGANDLCDFCQDREKFSAKSYIENIQSALDYLHENVPRAFVNMVEVLNVEIAKDLANNLLCQAIHVFTCDCAANPKNKAMEEELIVLRQAYQEAVRLLVETGRYDSRDDFTVVLQPFYRKTFLPKTEAGDLDYSFFASDCFHYSKKGQQAAAEALWNNMVEPVGQKRLEWTPGEEIECPTEDTPYLFTSKNSRSKRHPHPRPRH